MIPTRGIRFPIERVISNIGPDIIDCIDLNLQQFRQQQRLAANQCLFSANNTTDFNHSSYFSYSFIYPKAVRSMTDKEFQQFFFDD